ncbi:MAG: pseudouridine synthase [Candidatus Lokiarchaeota archaeon]|nr:pseudouridine synthase [Candidatus Lokiarchaeota archaeon]
MDNTLILGLRQVKAISDYQFGKGITNLLFKDINSIRIERSSATQKIRYIFLENNLILTLRPNNGFFTLSIHSARIIINNFGAPKLRVVVLNEISEFIKKGRNVFCKHVVDIDENLRPLDEVIVVNQDDELLAIGRLKLPKIYVKSFSSGIAVNVRKGVYKSKI